MIAPSNRCAYCGRDHAEIEFSFAADFPDPYANLKREERETRALISSDQCVIDEVEFYLRGCLEIPIQGTGEVFLWGLWARVHQEDFEEIEAHWEIAGKERMIGPYKGRLANGLSIYPGTLNLKLEIRIQPKGTRPLFFIMEEHSLATEQREGVSSAKAAEYACLLLRMSTAPSRAM